MSSAPKLRFIELALMESCHCDGQFAVQVWQVLPFTQVNLKVSPHSMRKESLNCWSQVLNVALILFCWLLVIQILKSKVPLVFKFAHYCSQINWFDIAHENAFLVPLESLFYKPLVKLLRCVLSSLSEMRQLVLIDHYCLALVLFGELIVVTITCFINIGLYSIFTAVNFALAPAHKFLGWLQVNAILWKICVFYEWIFRQPLLHFARIVFHVRYCGDCRWNTLERT